MFYTYKIIYPKKLADIKTRNVCLILEQFLPDDDGEKLELV